MFHRYVFRLAITRYFPSQGLRRFLLRCTRVDIFNFQEHNLRVMCRVRPVNVAHTSTTKTCCVPKNTNRFRWGLKRMRRIANNLLPVHSGRVDPVLLPSGIGTEEAIAEPTTTNPSK